MDLKELADILEKAAGPDQGMRYHNGKQERRYDSVTGAAYWTRDPTELSIFGDRARNFYVIISNGKEIAAQIREAISR